MEKVNRNQGIKILVFVACSLLIIASFAPTGTFLKAPLEDDWMAEPMHISQLASSSYPVGYFPSQIRAAYGLPSSGGAGTIAIIDAYDTPSIWGDLGNFSNQFNLPLPSISNFEVIKMDPNTGTNSDWAQETCLDVEWAHAIAPNAKILLVEAKDANTKNLLLAVDNATSRSDVVAVSMSWGGTELPNEVNSDWHFNKPGVVFFAASGDNGSAPGAYWPASSPYVVGVGGTTLNLNTDGTVSSETGWSGSGGGISTYEAIPAYQTSYGVTGTKRVVPDVSYNGNPSTGVAVRCNSQWFTMGGTSAGAPQWAAIYALGLSATNTNLYQRAKVAYSSYFRDITSGSSGNYSAAIGYDLVTGLGSPLTFNFGALTVTPSSGPPGGSIMLEGIGFLGSSANISYLNPINSLWIPLVNNLATATGNFSYTFNAPDLLQNNPTGDSQPLFDNIIFRAQDNSNGRSYNTTVPYTEWRRGLTQVSNFTSQGLLGNNTDLASSVFVQSGDTVPFSGEWFSPGEISLLWDTTNLGTISTDNNGFFNTTIIIPTTATGQHTLTISDGGANFCVNLTRLPMVANDYVDGWHTSDFSITLTPDYSVNETFYRINDGPVFNVTANGQPAITTEGSSNKLEYWSTWDMYGTGIKDLPHVTLTGIKLEKTASTGALTTGATITQTPTITLTLYSVDSTSGITQMRFSNDNATWSAWEPYATSKTWTLQGGDGQKTVTAQFRDNAGLTSTASYTLTLETPQPTATATPSPSPAPTDSSAPIDPQTSTPSVPEAPAWILIAFVLCTLMLAMLFRKNKQH